LQNNQDVHVDVKSGNTGGQSKGGLKRIQGAGEQGHVWLHADKHLSRGAVEQKIDACDRVGRQRANKSE
jgi:hypothetical protein